MRRRPTLSRSLEQAGLDGGIPDDAVFARTEDAPSRQGHSHSGECTARRAQAASIAPRMPKTVHFVGAGRHQRRAILRARELGLLVVAA